MEMVHTSRMPSRALRMSLLIISRIKNKPSTTSSTIVSGARTIEQATATRTISCYNNSRISSR